MKNRLPIYGKRTLNLAFEFGLVLSETAKNLKIKITPEMTTHAEEVLRSELKCKGMKKTALNFVPIVMAILGSK